MGKNLLFFVLLLCSKFSMAQVNSTELPSLAPTRIQIVNAVSIPVNFYLQFSGCDGSNFTLSSGYSGTYFCESATAANIIINTQLQDGNVVAFSASLQTTKRYEIYRQVSGAWGVREL